MRQGVARALLLAFLYPLVTGCGGSGVSDGGAAPTGYAARARTETDTLAASVLPALLMALGGPLNLGVVGFVRCDLRGWRYRAEGDLFGAAEPAAIVTALAGTGLDVAPREDGSVLGRRGELSLLVGPPLGPPERAFRHYTLTHACEAYSDQDEAYAASADHTDYATLVQTASIRPR